MHLGRILAAGLIALVGAPVVGKAQAPCPPPACERACAIEYQKHIEACGSSSAAGNDCFDAAVLAYRTCLATCPK